MSGKYRGFFDILTGFFLGASTVKIYYESISPEEESESIIFRQNKKKIDDIRTLHENLKFGQSERVISAHSNRNAKDGLRHEVFKFGQPLRSPEVLYYKNHVVGYDAARKVPLWVAEHLTREKLNVGDMQAERSRSSFQTDPNIPGKFQATNEDYFKSGWTRGHMAPAGNFALSWNFTTSEKCREVDFKPQLWKKSFTLSGDNKFDQESMNETFFLSNILPQDYENNANFWYRLEVFCRNLTKKFSDVYVISGPLWLPCQQDGKKIVSYEVGVGWTCSF